jgi:hypothetical protein
MVSRLKCGRTRGFPESGIGRLQLHNRNLLERVAELISPVTGTWDEQLVSDTFVHLM